MPVPTLPTDWPYREVSTHIRCRLHLWHVQQVGTGPTLILLHGAGGATHSFRGLMPLLAQHYRIIALDLPGQGFSVLGPRNRCSLDAIAQDIAALIAQESWQPVAIIGHSAGGAIALRLAEMIPLKAVVGINAALGGFDGMAGWLFPVLANILSRLPLVPQLFSKFAGAPQQAHQLLASTGSKISAEGEAQYLHLLRQPSHVAATLAMMAQWNLDGLIARLPRQTTHCLLITGSADKAVPPTVSQRAASEMPNARWIDVPGLGHLMHEEAPDHVADFIHTFLTHLTPL